MAETQTDQEIKQIQSDEIGEQQQRNSNALQAKEN
jgi:hypothetical protein